MARIRLRDVDIQPAVFGRESLSELLEKRGEACAAVSIYMPTFRAGFSDPQNAIRFKNVLAEARNRLADQGVRTPVARAMLLPAESLAISGAFGREGYDGLAIFAREGWFRLYRLPRQFPERVVAGGRFHVKPLLPMLGNNGIYFVLAFSQNAVRLVQCSRYGVNEVPWPEGVSRSLAEFRRYDELDKGQVYQTFSGPRPAGAAEHVLSHGGSALEMSKEAMGRFLKTVDDAAIALMRPAGPAPLVLAGVEALYGMYRALTRYPHVLDGWLEGNPEDLTNRVLHDRAWSVVSPIFDQARRKSLERYNNSRSLNRVTHHLRRIVLAAYQGKVDTLFAAADTEQWGFFDPPTNAVELHDRAEPCDEDMVDFVVAHSLQHRAEVYVVPSGEVPDGAPAAAILRP